MKLVLFFWILFTLYCGHQPHVKPDLIHPLQYGNQIVYLKFKKIPAGNFMMGCNKKENNCLNDEEAHNVLITKDFYLGMYEVTRDEWKFIMGDHTKSNFGSNIISKCNFWDLNSSQDENFPMESVSYNQVKEFIYTLNGSYAQKGFYRLPTEAEWEYAAKGGLDFIYPWGNKWNKNMANCIESDSKWSGKTTSPVGSFPPNGYGLYDMTGNVLEWVEDWYDKDYYKSSPEVDPTGPESGSRRVVRGGSWGLIAVNCRSSYRYSIDPGSRNSHLGFRLVFVPSEGK